MTSATDTPGISVNFPPTNSTKHVYPVLGTKKRFPTSSSSSTSSSSFFFVAHVRAVIRRPTHRRRPVLSSICVKADEGQRRRQWVSLRGNNAYLAFHSKYTVGRLASAFRNRNRECRRDASFPNSRIRVRLIEKVDELFTSSFFFFTRIIHLDSSNLSHSRSRKERFLTLFRSFLASRSSLETFLFVFSSLEKSPLVYSSQLLHVVSGCGKIGACFIGDVSRIADTCEGKWVGIHPIPCNIIQGDDASLDIEYRKYLISE